MPRLSEYAEEHIRIPVEDNQIGGSWDSYRFAHLTDVLDALTDEDVEEVVFVAATQQGKSRVGLAWVDHTVVTDPCPMLIVLPNLEDAQNFSRLRLAPMIRENKAMRQRIGETRGRYNFHKGDETNVVQTKTFPGGYLKLVGAHSARGLRSNPVAKAIAEEVDTMPAAAGQEGDQIRLIERRMDNFPNHKLYINSTPGLKATSRVLQRYARSDRRVREVPCPHCQTFQALEWDNLKWDKTEDGEHLPETAHFVCVSCQQDILPRHQLEMCSQGRWVKQQPDITSRAGFWLWAAYTRDWRTIAKEWLEACDDGHEAIVAFVNTVRAEGWEEPGEAPAWEVLQGRAEPRASWTIPPEVYFLTAGVDVQGDRLEATILGWGLYQEVWVIAHDILYGDTALDDVWYQLDDLVETPRPQEQTGLMLNIVSGCIDTGHQKDMAYAFARRHANMHAIKGSSLFTAPILSRPSLQDVTIDGRTERQGLRLWTLGVSAIKSLVYSRLRIASPAPRYIHFPYDLPVDYYKQLTSEKMVVEGNVTKFEVTGPNEALDCMVYNVGAAWIAQVYKIPWELVREKNPRPNQTNVKPPAPEEPPLRTVEKPIAPTVGVDRIPSTRPHHGLGMAQQLLRGD